MPTNPLKSHLTKASRMAVIDAVAKLRSHIGDNRWIGINNIYAKVYKKESYREVLTRRPTLKSKQVSDYVAASIFTHCGDGWSLLGRALSAASTGDVSTATHLAYYAELRAAMSLLAAEGIGVFNNRHVILTDAGAKLTPSLKGDDRILSRTHKFAWMALEHWADRKLSAEILSEIISPGSINLSNWVDAFGVASNLHPIGRLWLRSWGIDIKQFGEDQVLRNHSSYRPSRIVARPIPPASETVAFLKEVWRLCEPVPASRFNEIDKQLLRISLAQAYKALKGLDPSSATNKPDYRVWLESNITKLGFDAELENAWIGFLVWEIQPEESKLLKYAATLGSVEELGHHLQVIARATLLLRLASGLAAKLLKSTGYTMADLEFWWRPYASDHGIIADGEVVGDFLDLWADAETALGSVSDWERTAAAPYSYNDIRTNVSSPIALLGECERVNLWGLGI